MATGRPTVYSIELVDEICEHIATSEVGLHILCKELNYPSVTTLMRWLAEPDKEYFREQYARARELQAEFMKDQILNIADDTTNDTIQIQIRDKKGDVISEKDIENTEWTNRSRLRVEARKWLMSKLAPKKYGDKMDIEHSGEIKGVQVQVITSGVPIAKSEKEVDNV